MLFVLYISDLIDMLNEEGCIGMYRNADAPSIVLLLFADAIAMCSDMPGRLQHMLNILKKFCDKWGLKLNLLKTKILVFRRGGIVKRNEKWFYGGKIIVCVKQYKYLGSFFTTTLSWSLAKRTLAAQANKALGMLCTTINVTVHHMKCI